ncbi:MAG: hypothetical protein ACT4NY_05180, partial [Pseudonocardiales bacterium]
MGDQPVVAQSMEVIGHVSGGDLAGLFTQQLGEQAARVPVGERVSWALTHWAEGDYWTGNEQASTIVGIPKP